MGHVFNVFVSMAESKNYTGQLGWTVAVGRAKDWRLTGGPKNEKSQEKRLRRGSEGDHREQRQTRRGPGRPGGPAGPARAAREHYWS